MKKRYTIIYSLLGLLCANIAKSQVDNLLVYSSPANTYTEVSGGLTLGSATSDDQVIVNPNVLIGGSTFGATAKGLGLPLGFNFVIGTDTFDRIGVSINGWVRLGKSINGTTAINMSNFGNYNPISAGFPSTLNANNAFTISGFGVDLLSRTTASLTFFTDSLSPIKSTTIQWKNYMKYANPPVASDTINFQITISSDGNIALNYGNFSRAIPIINKIEVGVRDFTSFVNRSTSSNWSATTTGINNTDTCRFSSTVFPANGLSFLYSPAPTCSGIPLAGNIFADTTVCLNSIVTIKDTGYTPGPGISFQWYFNGIAVAGANSPSFSDTVTSAGAYYCAVTCLSGSPAQSNTITTTLNPAYLCYCLIDSNTTSNFGTDIGNVTIGAFSNGLANPITNNANANRIYSDFTNLPPIPLSSGISSTIQLTGITSSFFTSFTNIYSKVYIDYNKDGIFDPITEMAFTANGDYSGPNSSVLNGNLNVPISALTGITGMRIMMYEDSIINACSIPNFADGEIEDYLVDIQLATACSGAPIGGSIISTDSLVCAASLFSLSLNSATVASGITYQWFANGVAIVGDTLSTLNNISQSVNTNYTCVLTCSNSTLSAISSGLLINMDSAIACACIPTFTNGCDGDEITGVSVNGLINITPDSCGAFPFYNLYSTPIFNANPGDSTFCYFSHDVITNQFTHIVNVWIDYNDDFFYSDSERVITNLLLQDTSGTAYTYFIAKSDTGFHGMRVVQNFAPSLINPQSCGTYDYGEVEDYVINISDTVTTISSLGKSVAKNTAFKISLFPNPTTGILNYQIPSTVKNNTITVSDLLGRTLISKSGNNTNTIDLSELKNGTYTVTMNLDGKLVQSKIILNK
jgi:hypothetical protein